MPDQGAVTGVVLAGGKSRRLGRNKAVEPFEGRPLMARVVDRLAQVCDELVAVVAADTEVDALPLPPSAMVTADLYPAKGSLGGVYSGLAAATSPWAIVVACDMPFLNVDLLRHMLSLRDGHDAVVAVVDGRPEPTHALYSKACLDSIRRRLERDELKIAGFFGEVRVAYLPEDQVRRFDPELLSFLNVNTQQDLDRALALAAEGR